MTLEDGDRDTASELAAKFAAADVDLDPADVAA
jgi:hypothetical protein